MIGNPKSVADKTARIASMVEDEIGFADLIGDNPRGYSTNKITLGIAILDNIDDPIRGMLDGYPQNFEIFT
jgi:hypothetical protein